VELEGVPIPARQHRGRDPSDAAETVEHELEKSPGVPEHGRCYTIHAVNPILAAGLTIGVLCGLWTIVCGMTGWYTRPAIFISVATAIEIVVLIWGLSCTARERRWLGQIVAGTMMAVIAGVIIIASSLLCTMVLFPEAVQSAADVAGATPMAQAMSGFLGTLFTGIIASALLGAFLRKK
jgi:hypothetical protein